MDGDRGKIQLKRVTENIDTGLIDSKGKPIFRDCQ